jgi:fatty acid desaturase
MTTDRWTAEQQKEDRFVSQALHAHALLEWQRDKRRRLRKGIFWAVVVVAVLGFGLWLAVLAWGGN